MAVFANSGRRMAVCRCLASQLGPQQQEQIEGKPLQVQRFERNRLELHPENQRPYDVLLGRLGADRLAQQGRDWYAEFPKSGAQGGCRFFSETGHNVCAEVLTAWRANGLEIDGQNRQDRRRKSGACLACQSATCMSRPWPMASSARCSGSSARASSCTPRISRRIQCAAGPAGQRDPRQRRCSHACTACGSLRQWPISVPMSPSR